MWRVINVIHYSNFGFESGYTHTGGKTVVFFGKNGKFIQKTLTSNQTKYKKGEYYDIDA